MAEEKVYYGITKAQELLLWSQFFALDKKKAKNFNVLSFYFTVRENADIGALVKAYQYILRSNDAFRLRMEKHGLKYRQYIAPYEPEVPEVIEVANEAAFQAFLGTLDQYIIPFCAKKPVWARIVRYGNCASLVLRVHHLCMDGYSLELILEQLEDSYSAYAAGREPETKTYGSVVEYFEADQKYRKGNEFKRDLAYWKKQFLHQRDFHFPTRMTSGGGASEQYTLPIDHDRYQALSEFADRYSVSFIQIIMSLTALVVYELTGLDNFSCHTLTHGRRTGSLRSTVGCMMNTYPVFFDIDPSLSMEEYLKKQRSAYLNAMMHSRFSISNQIPLTYYEAVKNKMRFDCCWILFSKMDFASGSEKSEYEFVSLPLRNIPYQFYCYVFTFGDDHGEIKLNYRKKMYSEQDIARYGKMLTDKIDKLINHPDTVIRELRRK